MQDFSEVQRRKVVLRSRLEDWYLQYSNLSQIYEPILLEIKKIFGSRHIFGVASKRASLFQETKEIDFKNQTTSTHTLQG